MYMYAARLIVFVLSLDRQKYTVRSTHNKDRMEQKYNAAAALTGLPCGKRLIT